MGSQEQERGIRIAIDVSPGAPFNYYILQLRPCGIFVASVLCISHLGEKPVVRAAFPTRPSFIIVPVWFH
jgi:hypothetical protein